MAAVTVVSGMTAVGFVVLTGGGGQSEPPSAAARLAGKVFAADPSATTDGRDQELTGVSAVGSTVVAVGGEADDLGARAQFLVSDDAGRSFRLAAVRTPRGEEPPFGDAPRHVAGSTAGWVALGNGAGGGVAWTSRNGRTWTRHPDAAKTAFTPHDRIARLIWTGSGYLAVGATSAKGDFSDPAPVIWRSPSGTRWERQAIDDGQMSAEGGTLSLINATANGSTVLVQGLRTTGPKDKPEPRNILWRSSDNGRSWEETAVPVPNGTTGLSVTAAPSGFLAIREVKDKTGAHSKIFGSADGIKWAPAGEVRLPGYQRLLRLFASPQGMTALVTGKAQVLVGRSLNGQDWEHSGTVTLPGSRVVLDSAVAAEQIILVGREVGRQQDSNAVLTVRDAQGREVPVNLSQVPGAVQADKAVRDVATAGGRVVAVGNSGGDAAIWTSGDGDHWQRAQMAGALPGPQRLVDVTSGQAGWLSVGLNGAFPWRPMVATSTDGTTWQLTPDGDAFRPKRNTHLATYGAAAGPAGYVIVGEDGPSAATWFSADLKVWERGGGAGKDDLVGKDKANRWMRGVAGGPFGYVAVGGVNDPSARNSPAARPAVWTCVDGRKWTRRQLPLPTGTLAGWLAHIAAKGDLLVATGIANTPTSTRPMAYVSADGGRTWQETRLPGPGQDGFNVASLTATPTGFAAAGTSGRPGATDVALWTSKDGRNWTLERPEGTGLSGRGEQELHALTTIGNEILAIGFTADHKGKEPTLWRRPVP